MRLHTRNAPAVAGANSELAPKPPAGTDHRGAPPPSRGNRSADVTPSTYDAAQHTVEVVLSSGARVTRWYGVEELLIDPAAIDLSRVASGACKVLDSHNAYSIEAMLGSVLSARIESGQLIGVIKFNQSEAGVRAEGMVARGELNSISIGYNVSTWRNVEIITDPTTGGETYVWQAAAWALYEASFLSVPADPKASVRSAETPDTSANSGDANKELEMHTRNAPGDAKPAVVPAVPAAAAPASGADRIAPASDPAAPAARTGAFAPGEETVFGDQARSFGLEAEGRTLIGQVAAGTITAETARRSLMEKAAQRQLTAGSDVRATVTITDDARDKWMRGAMASLMHRAGVAGIVQRAAEMRGEKVDLNPGEFRGVRNVDLARMALENMGVRISTYNRDDIVRTAFMSTRGANSLGDFPILLENTMHKTLQAAYLVTPDTWSVFCGKGSVVDFRPHPRYLRGTFGTLDSLSETGEFKQKQIPDGAKESISASTKGNIVALTRNAIVNDDLGAFSNVATDLGRAAKLSIEVDVYALLAMNSGAGPTMNDGNPLFHASHNNIAAVSAAPGVVPFDAMRQQMASQKDVSGNEFLDIRPDVWLGPLSIGGAARVVNGSEYDPDTASKLQRMNIAKGLFKTILDTPRLTGTPWYGFADPAIAPAIEVVFLDGVQEPFLESEDGWRTDGTEWKVRLDYGVGGVNWRSAAKNPGA